MHRSASMLVFWGFLLVIASFPLPTAGMDVPLLLKWTSANTFDITPEQTGKQYAWNEFYRLEAAIDSLNYRDMQLSLALRSHANFLTTYMSVEKAVISYQLPGLSVGAEVSPSGYGIQNMYHPAHIVVPAQDDYLFQPLKFHGLYANWGKRIVWKAEAGGNEHNLAVGKISASFPLAGAASGILLSQEARTFESHLHKPVFTSAMEVNLSHETYAVQSLVAVAVYPAFEQATASVSPFMLAEAVYYPADNLFVHFSAHSSDAYGTDYRNNHGELTLGKKYRAFVVAVGLNRDRIDHCGRWGSSLVCKWNPVPETSIGVFSEVSDPESGYLYYRFGMQAELCFGS